MPEEHNKQFRGVWIPPEVMEMVETKTISIKEAWLLMVIESLIEHGGEDCFASNKYLARRIHTSEDRVSRLIGNLKEQELLIETKFDGRNRYLKTATSQLRRKQRSGFVENNEAPNININNNKITHGPDSKVGTPCSPSKPKQHPRWVRYAAKLKGAIEEVRKVNINSKVHTWPNSFRLLHEKDGVPVKRIRIALLWYCVIFKEQRQFIPVAHSAHSFREKFMQIEMAMQRTEKPYEPPKPKVAPPKPLSDEQKRKDDQWKEEHKNDINEDEEFERFMHELTDEERETYLSFEDYLKQRAEELGKTIDGRKVD